jgi:flagellar biosynthesis protein FlhF
MNLRTFRGNSIAEALAAVKRDLGPDALVVHTRSFKVGGVLGVGAREEIEIIASAAPAATPRPAPAKAQTGQNDAKAAALRLAAAYAPSRAAEPVRPAPARIPAAPVPQPQAEVMQVRQRRSGVVATIAPVPQTATPAPAPADVHGELGAIKLMVAQLLAANPAPSASPAAAVLPGDPLADWYLRLLSAAVSRELAEQIVAEVRRGAPGNDSAALRRAFLSCIAAHLPAAREPLALPGPTDPRPRAVAIVGATGVGKTTTVAKLAAQAKLNADTRVALVTCDTNRIGAIEQLRTYAQVLGVPFRVAASAQEMAAARAAFSSSDLLLIDTPGLSPKDERAIGALSELLAPARPDEVHLALPASGSESALLHAWRAFQPLAPSRLLFTKLDEAVTYGVILSVADQVKAELSYLTTGPRIPEQIEAANPSRVAELIAA